MDDGTPVLLNPAGRDIVVEICTELNSRRSFPWTVKLKELVALWEAAGRNTYAMETKDKALWGKIRESFEVEWIVPRNPGTPRTHLMFRPTLPQDADRYAYSLFAQFTLSPHCENLGGPCPRPGPKGEGICGKYFVRTTEKEKRYCSRECGSIAGALEATSRKREKKHKDKLDLAREAILKYNPRRTKKNWKEWVVSYCTELEVSQKWLTRAVTNGQLVPPAATM
ncbi:MAG: hypothetical protein ACRD6B_03255 [Bryobacteraceae bacterium]